MNNKVRKTVRYIFLFLLAAVLIFFAFREVRWAEFKAALKACSWGPQLWKLRKSQDLQLVSWGPRRANGQSSSTRAGR